ncbi:MAG: hypothetical protein PHI27_03930 [Eubacteriales bacterium]|nr:hypothetical protein [Eubacteriales bacterium]MDD3881384.1 hypothetical protein [Eubacteriales bacterium]MDD4513071.1 hypothetical protein [Eubacteriales bacterium]
MYLLWLGIGAAICCALFAFLLHSKKAGSAAQALLVLPIAVILGTALSKLMYFICKISAVLPTYGLAALIRNNPNEFSFVGAAIGVVIAVIIVSRIFGKEKSAFLSAFAPAGALMIAIARFGEYMLGTIGVGNYIDAQSLCFFPLAMENEWHEWYAAVFMLEGLLALICVMVSLISYLRGGKDVKHLFSRTVFYLCVPQIISESLRAVSMKWGFVRIEQVFCAFAALGIILYNIILSGRKGLRAFFPFIGAALCVILCVGVEFALDKTTLPNLLCYAVMLLALCGMSAAEIFSVKYRKSAESAGISAKA